MRLKYIERADFRKSELTNFFALKRRSLKPGEVACLVSSTGLQIVFVYAPGHVHGGPEDPDREVLRSEKLRLTSGGRWNPMMLGNYAQQVGLDLEGIKLFEVHYERLWQKPKSPPKLPPKSPPKYAIKSRKEPKNE